MGKVFLGNPYNVESEYEDDDLTFIVEDSIEFESSVDSIDINEPTDSEGDNDDDDDFFFGSSNDSEWMDDDSYVSETDLEDQEDDDDDLIEDIIFPEVSADTISNSKPSTESENISSDINPAVQEPPSE